MFCEHCGNKINNSDKFCTKCGKSVTSSRSNPPLALNDKWWHRLLKVLYATAYLPLLIVIPLVWSANEPYCGSYSNYCSNSYDASIGYSFLTLIIYMIILRLLKIAVLYIAIGRPPEWKRQFRKLY